MGRVEERNICAECGGACCKNCGCDYFVSDFESLKIDYLESILGTGRVSVVAALKFQRMSNEKLTVNPILYLRARNINREEIDLLSFKTTCASLEDGGCHFDLAHRPGGGAAFIPVKDGECRSGVDMLEELEKWIPYQNLLQRIVKRHTGKTIYAKLKEDVFNLFYDLMMKNVDGVSAAELKDVLTMVPSLSEVYKEEYEKAEKMSNNTSLLIMKKAYSKKNK